MSFINIGAEETTTPFLVTSMSLTNESRATDDPDVEEYRAIFRVNLEVDAKKINFISQPTNTIVALDTLPVGFNDGDQVTIYALIVDEVTYPFKLLTQGFTQKNQRGSKFFNVTQEWVSVSPWGELIWE